jgi:quercetin dioxygenase-like cupin family protein
MDPTPTEHWSLLHLYTDERGDTHVGTTALTMSVNDFAPPATPFHVSDALPATKFLLIHLPAGWVGEAHTSPKRQVLFCLSGQLKITCSTGETVIVETGMGILMEDETGRGHSTEVTSEIGVTGVMIQ